LSRLLDEVAERFPVDSSRVYAMGFSNGGSMALRLAAELPGRIAAVAACAGHPFAAPLPGARPVPTLCVIGGADPIVPPDGGRVRLPWGHALEQPSYIDAVRAWALAQGCAREAEVDASHQGVERRTWRGPADAEVALYVVAGAGHVWPGGTTTMHEMVVGTDPGTFDATATALDFLLSKQL
jgi:polyhydroxybutyrate depolymerase